MLDAASQFVKSELRKLGLKRRIRTQLKLQYCIASRCEFACGFRVSWVKAVFEWFYGICSLSMCSL